MNPNETPPAPYTFMGATPLVWSLMILTFPTGLVDAVSFLGLGRVFTANMTGNIVFIAFALTGADGLSVPHSVFSLVTFMVGAVLGGLLANTMKGSTHRRWLIMAATLETVLILGAAGFAYPYDYQLQSPEWALYGIIGTTAIAMGFRNATVLRIAEPDLKTTVLTLTVTGIAADSSLAGGTNPRMGRRGVSSLMLFAGAGVGALMLFAVGSMWPLLLMAALIVGGTAVYVAHPSSLRIWEGKKR